jgi:hypothetical protein
MVYKYLSITKEVREEGRSDLMEALTVGTAYDMVVRAKERRDDQAGQGRYNLIRSESNLGSV